MTQHAIGSHALLADGRTAALVDPDGNIAWLCWPRIDSAPLLFSLLDERRGGCCTVRPAAPGCRLLQRAYHEGSLVLRTTWRVPGGVLHIDDALNWVSGPQLLRRVTAEVGEAEVEVRFAVSGPDAPLLHIAGAVHDTHGAGVHRFTVRPGTALTVALGGDAPHADALTATLSAWRSMTMAAGSCALAANACAAIGEPACRSAVRTAAAVLVGLRQRGGGIVAAPTTSLPQWPESSRTWDYRYCWLRDASLAGLALVRLGLLDDAHALSAFLGEVCAVSELRPLVCVDGTAAPTEREVAEWSGYQGARPVRIGNYAAAQLQLDFPGEVLEFASALAARDALSDALRNAVPRLATWVSDHWREPDAGIWEIRGPRRHYTHSQIMCWLALRDSARLADASSDAAQSWAALAHHIAARVVDAFGDAPLQLHSGGGGADAALSVAPLISFVEPRSTRARRLLDFIERRLDRNGLLDRHEAGADPNPEPCGAFLFPSFWMAAAQFAAGLDGSRHLVAAMRAQGPLALFGEVADPRDGGPLGNYPQVQSHAACVLALTPSA